MSETAEPRSELRPHSHAPFHGNCLRLHDELLKIRPKFRPGNSQNLPGAPMLEEPCTIPSKGAFSLPIFKQASYLGRLAMMDSARAWVVKTPGTLGTNGSWRLDGHRIAIVQMLGFVIGPDHARHVDVSPQNNTYDPAGIAAALAMESFDWTDEFSTRDKLFAACSFAYLYTDLAIESCRERDDAMLAQALNAARSFLEAEELSSHAKQPAAIGDECRTKSL